MARRTRSTHTVEEEGTRWSRWGSVLHGRTVPCIVVLLLAVTGLHAQGRVIFSVLGNGATRSGAPSWELHGTVGQPAIGVSASPMQADSAGFWYLHNSLGQVVDVGQPRAMPLTTGLMDCYPNPAGQRVRIGFSMQLRGTVSISVCDLLGRLIAMPVYASCPPGIHEVNVDVSGMTPGPYLVRMRTGRFESSRMMVVVRQ